VAFIAGIVLDPLTSNSRTCVFGQEPEEIMITNGKDGEGDINRRKNEIFQDWVQGKSPGQIARERRLRVEVVYQQLKEIQKQLIVKQEG
jgi:DNA-binding NarL/FixJ family response regulator